MRREGKPTLVALLESTTDYGEMGAELVATCNASLELAVDEVLQVWQLLLDLTKDHLGGGVPAEGGLELGAEHSLRGPGGDVVVKVVELVSCHGPKGVELRAFGHSFLDRLQEFNVVEHFIGELDATMRRQDDSRVSVSHITHQPMTNGLGPHQPRLIVGVVGGGTLDFTANDSQEIEVCKGELDFEQPVLKSPDTGRVIAGDDANGFDTTQIVCLSWSWGGHRVGGQG